MTARELLQEILDLNNLDLEQEIYIQDKDGDYYDVSRVKGDKLIGNNQERLLIEVEKE